MFFFYKVLNNSVDIDTSDILFPQQTMHKANTMRLLACFSSTHLARMHAGGTHYLIIFNIRYGFAVK